MMRELRSSAGDAPTAEVARIVGRAASMMEFDDLQIAAGHIQAEPTSPEARYDFGYACIERGAAYLAVPVLSEALRLAPTARACAAGPDDISRPGPSSRFL